MAERQKEKIITDAAAFTVEAIEHEDRAAADRAEKEMLKEAERRDQSKLSAKMAESMVKMQEVREKENIKSKTKTVQDIEDAKRKQVEAKIKKYVAAFPGLASVIPKPSTRASLIELEEILTQIRDEISSQRSLYRVRNYANQLFTFLESTWGDGSGAPDFVPPQARVNLLKISDYYRRGAFEAEVEPLLLEIDIEYPWLGRSNLLMRGLEAVTTVCLKTNAINTNPMAKAVLLGEEQVAVETKPEEGPKKSRKPNPKAPKDVDIEGL